MHRVWRVVVLGVLLLAAGCSTVPDAAEPSLYQRIGGKPAFSAAMTRLLARVSNNPKIKQRFARTDLEFLAGQLTTQFCQATGGPCVYDGPNMRRAHRGLNIKADEFEAMAADLTVVLTEMQVPTAEQQALLRIFNSMKADVILQ